MPLHVALAPFLTPPRSAAPPCSALASLPRLRLLSLTLTEALPAGHHRQLAALRSLEELHLYFTPAQPTAFEFQPSALAALTRLRSVLLVAPRDSMCQPLTIGPGMSKLAALQELQVCCHCGRGRRRRIRRPVPLGQPLVPFTTLPCTYPLSPPCHPPFSTQGGEPSGAAAR